MDVNGDGSVTSLDVLMSLRARQGAWRSVRFKYHGDADPNCMRRYASLGRIKVSLLTYPGELAEVCGKIKGMKSLCAVSVLKCGVW